MDGGSPHKPAKRPGVEIRVYLVFDSRGEVVGAKLNRSSATALVRLHPGGDIKPVVADKRFPE